MRITVETVSKTIKELMGEDQYNKLNDGRESREFSLVIQNLGTSNVFIENGFDATVEDSIIIPAGTSSSPVTYYNMNRLYLISEGQDNHQIRFITL